MVVIESERFESEIIISASGSIETNLPVIICRLSMLWYLAPLWTSHLVTSPLLLNTIIWSIFHHSRRKFPWTTVHSHNCNNWMIFKDRITFFKWFCGSALSWNLCDGLIDLSSLFRHQNRIADGPEKSWPDKSRKILFLGRFLSLHFLGNAMLTENMEIELAMNVEIPFTQNFVHLLVQQTEIVLAHCKEIAVT